MAIDNPHCRFKIALTESSWGPFGLYVRQPALWGQRWRLIDRFQKRDDAVAFYEKIKDLPEYLA